MTEDPPAPFARGLLPVADGARIYWETSGAPDGHPALWLHGGPGSGLGRGGYRGLFDLRRDLVVGIDQRGCGRSRPLATDAGALARNTTAALIADIEAVRAHLGIARWRVAGGSWGTTLALAYAQAHPDRVSALALAAVTTTSREEVDWITEGVGRFIPEAFAAFEAAAERRPGERLVEAYARRLAAGDAQERLRAARAWTAWEAAHIRIDRPEAPVPPFDPERDTVFATLVTHYWARDGFLTGEDAILRRLPAIVHIPAVLIHGRRDWSGPVVTPWRLHRLWPASRLEVVETEGHGGPEMNARMRRALAALPA
ncbi:prolyl aminopeptidase [Methylobacterium sp. JK268]